MSCARLAGGASMDACVFKSPGAVQQSIAVGAEVSAKNRDSESVLILARKSNNARVVEALTNAGAK